MQIIVDTQCIWDGDQEATTEGCFTLTYSLLTVRRLRHRFPPSAAAGPQAQIRPAQARIPATTLASGSARGEEPLDDAARRRGPLCRRR